MNTILTVDHAYDGGSRLELIFTGRVQATDLAEIASEIALGYQVEAVMVDCRGADYTLNDTIEDALQEIEYETPVIPVRDAATWGDRLYEAKQLLKEYA